jgi:hypothetical protein
MVSGKTHEMPVPPKPTAPSAAVEIARVWAADGELHVALDARAWADPAAWGIMLVDLARHVARAYEQAGGMSQAQALARLREGFDAEWQSAP